jgi:tetratricopeptide (TPR) repeat protein
VFGKFAIFGLLWILLGNPVAAIVVLIIILYILDRRFVGLSPSVVKPFRRARRIRQLKQQLSLNPNDMSARMELAHLLIERKAYGEARRLLEPAAETMAHSAEYWDDLGTALLFTGSRAEGESAIRRALDINPRVKYGQPYLRLAAVNRDQPEKALKLLDELQAIHSSSCEAYYRMGMIYKALGRREEARRALDEAAALYRTLPRYKRREERPWAIRSRLARLFA